MKLKSLTKFNKGLILFFFLSLMGLAISFIFRPIWQAGYANGYDTLIHIFKVAQIKDLLLKRGTFVDWSGKWYNGFHLFLFYPPLFYFLAVLTDLSVNNLALTSKIMAVAGVYIAAVSTFLLVFNTLPPARKYWRRALAATAGGLFYSLNPILLSFINLRGKYPDFWAFALMPLAFMFLVLWLKSRRQIMPLGFTIALAAIMLTHIDVAVTLAIVAVIFSIVYLKLSLGHRNQFFNRFFHKPLALLGLAFILFTGLTAFFWLPYLAYLKSVGALAQLYPTRAPLSMSVYWRGELAYGITRYPGIILMITAIAALAVKRLRKIFWPWAAVAVTGVLFSLFSYSKTIRDLPAINTLFYRSGMVMATLALGVLASITIYGILDWDRRSFLNRHIPKFNARVLTAALPILVVVLIVSAAAVDYSFIFNPKYIQAQPRLDGELSQVVAYLRDAKQVDKGRLLIIAPPTADYTYLPVVTGKPIVNGYEAQASKTSVDVDVLVTKKLRKKTQRAAILADLNRWNVQYVLVDRWKYKSEFHNLLATKKFKKVFTGGRFSIIEYKPTGYIQAIRPILLIGRGLDYPSEVLDEIPGIGFIKGKSVFVDDYSLKELNEFDAVILYGFESNNLKKSQTTLSSYARQGGNVFMAMDGGLTNLLPGNSYMGISAVDKEFSSGAAIVSPSIGGGTIELKRKSSKWSAKYLRGKMKPLVTIDNKYPVIGTREIGRGEVLFIGYNFFYHAILNNDSRELNLLRNTVKRVIKDKNVILTHKITDEGPKKISMKVSVSEPTWSRVSMSWSPFWRAYVDGNQVSTKNYNNVLAVHLPKGEHAVELRYKNTSLYYLASFISLIAWLYALALPFIRRRKRPKATGTRFQTLSEEVDTQIKKPVKV